MPQITCSRCGKVAEQLPSAPMPGKWGEMVLNQTCGDCWTEWKAMMINIINHYGLQPVNPKDREALYQFMEQFLQLRG